MYNNQQYISTQGICIDMLLIVWNTGYGMYLYTNTNMPTLNNEQCAFQQIIYISVVIVVV